MWHLGQHFGMLFPQKAQKFRKNRKISGYLRISKKTMKSFFKEETSC